MSILDFSLEREALAETIYPLLFKNNNNRPRLFSNKHNPIARNHSNVSLGYKIYILMPRLEKFIFNFYEYENSFLFLFFFFFLCNTTYPSIPIPFFINVIAQPTRENSYTTLCIIPSNTIILFNYKNSRIINLRIIKIPFKIHILATF